MSENLATVLLAGYSHTARALGVEGTVDHIYYKKYNISMKLNRDIW